MFLMVRNDLFHTEEQNRNIKNIQEKPELTVTKTKEQQTGQKDFFNVRKILMTQARKESVSNCNQFAEKDIDKSKPLEKHQSVTNKIYNRDRMVTKNNMPNEDELLEYFLEKIM